MNGREARAIAQRWVEETASTMPNVLGAFLHGSIHELADDAWLPATSDVDIMVVVQGDAPALKLGKFVYRNLLLEVSFLAATDLASVDAVLAQYTIAPSLRHNGILLDRSGHLTTLQAAVARQFACRRWVRARCNQARQTVLRHASAVHAGRPYHDQVLGWLFAAGVTTHVLLVAGLRNPTVRERYCAVRELLDGYGCAGFYPILLDLMGAMAVTRRQAETHLDALAQAFDTAGTVLATSFRFAADMRPAARSVAIDGSRGLIRRGEHREALFWITAVYSRCMHVLAMDGTPALLARHATGYHRLLADLGINGPDDLQHGTAEIIATLPALWTRAEAIMAANPAIVGCAPNLDQCHPGPGG